MFASTVKPDTVRAPLSVLTEARRLVDERDAPRPAVVAIGGITPDNARLVAQAGADAIAVITALFEAPSIRAAATACSAPYSVNPLRKP
ncbi:Regulatory protein TenI [compost metagenome]